MQIYICVFSSRTLENGGRYKACLHYTDGRGQRGAYASLNIGISRGDLRENVLENYRLLAAALGFNDYNVALTAQVHGDTIRIV